MHLRFSPGIVFYPFKDVNIVFSVTLDLFDSIGRLVRVVGKKTFHFGFEIWGIIAFGPDLIETQIGIPKEKGGNDNYPAQNHADDQP